MMTTLIILAGALMMAPRAQRIIHADPVDIGYVLRDAYPTQPVNAEFRRALRLVK